MSKAKVKQHDALVKLFLSDLKVAREFLKPLFNKFIHELTYYEGSIMTYAEELKQDGIQLGHQEAQIEIAQQLLKSGVDSIIIANATHLTPAQVEELKKSIS